MSYDDGVDDDVTSDSKFAKIQFPNMAGAGRSVSPMMSQKTGEKKIGEEYGHKRDWKDVNGSALYTLK